MMKMQNTTYNALNIRGFVSWGFPMISGAFYSCEVKIITNTTDENK